MLVRCTLARQRAPLVGATVAFTTNVPKPTVPSCAAGAPPLLICEAAAYSVERATCMQRGAYMHAAYAPPLPICEVPSLFGIRTRALSEGVQRVHTSVVTRA